MSDTIHAAYSAITIHRMRSLLTMLGIIIGVGSVVLMVSIGRTFEAYILDQVESFSNNLIEIYPTGFEKFGKTLDSLSYEDFEALEKLSTVESVAPVIFLTDSVKYENEEVYPYIFGTTSNFFNNYGLKLESGRLLDDNDENGARFVAVLGWQTAQDLFGDQNPLGEKIRIAGRSYTVVGVMQTLGSALMQDMDTPVYVPYKTALAATGQKTLSYISLKAKSDDDLAIADIQSILRQRHSIDNPENDESKDDFIARSAEQATEIIGQVTLGLTAFVGLIAGVSLLVGGIGIMNIMLVAVSERTKEIGLRKALGARKKDILTQFLLEAVSLTFLGGVIGIIGGAIIGMVLTAIAAKFLGDMRFALSVPALFAAVIMALGTGILFGIYPAKKASDLSPMEAIRWDR